VAKIAGPSVVAITALVISLLTYIDQHRVDTAAAAASYVHDAKQVSFVMREIPSPITVTIENTSMSPVNDVTLDTEGSFSRLGETRVVAKRLLIFLGSMPPCSVATLNLAKPIRLMADPPQKFRLPQTLDDYEVNAMYFNDRNSVSWEYLPSGSLIPIKPHIPPGVVTSIWREPKYTAASGCS
jgi:hypothetical protein